MAHIENRVDKLSTNNYSTWKTVIMSQLMGRDLWDYVVESKNDSDEEVVKNEQAKTLMYISMEAAQIAATGVCESAHQLWTKIKENHEGAIANLRSSSLAEFLGIKIRKNESIINYAGRFENALGKLESTGHIVDEKTRLWVFSNSLPQHLKLTVQMFTMANPEGRVSELISQLKIQHHLDGQDHDRQGAAYHAQERRQQPDNKTSLKPMSSITCNYCKKQGHMWRECRKLKADNERKKRFGQMNQNRQQENNSRGQNRPAQHQQQFNHKQNQITRPSGAFSMRKHEFSEGIETWIVDSGASSHMTPYRNFLVEFEEYNEPHKIHLGNGKSLEVLGRGNMPFSNNEFTGELKKVLWVPDLAENLFSIGRAMEQDCSYEFCKENSTVLFYRNNKLVLRGIKKPSSVYFLLTLLPLTADSEAEGTALMSTTVQRSTV